MKHFRVSALLEPPGFFVFVHDRVGIRAFVFPRLKVEYGVEKPTSMNVGIKNEILVDNVSPNPLGSRVEDERNEEGRNKYVQIS